VLPLREACAVVDDEAGDGGCRRQVDDRLLDAVEIALDAELLAVVDLSAVVVDALRIERPAVVSTGQKQIHLVASARSHLRAPKQPRLAIELETLGAAVAVRPDRGEGIGASDERIIRRDRAVALEPQDLAVRQ